MIAMAVAKFVIQKIYENDMRKILLALPILFFSCQSDFEGQIEESAIIIQSEESKQPRVIKCDINDCKAGDWYYDGIDTFQILEIVVADTVI